MTYTTFSEETSELLIGKKIIEVGHTYLVLDNGWRIYITQSEIEMLNQ